MKNQQKSLNETILDYIKANRNFSDIEIAKKLIDDYSEVNKMYKNRMQTLRSKINGIRTANNLNRDRKTKLSKEQRDIKIKREFEEDIKVNNLKESNQEIKDKYNFALGQLDKTTQLLNLAREIDQKKIIGTKIEINEDITKNQGTVIALLSDVHVEERIDPNSINGFNKYNPDIAKQRINTYFSNLRKMIIKERQDIVLENCIVACLGDMIHGFIHEEFMVSNYYTPIEASLYMYELLVDGFNFLLKDEELNNIKVIGKVGNHSRITFRPYSDKEALMSHEWAIYKHLQKYYENEKRIEFIIEEGYYTYYNVYGKVLRFHHGHKIQYRGGIGGVTIPLIKHILRANEQIRADMDFTAHFHTRFNLPTCLLNGSVCGFDAYALGIGAKPEVPAQHFQILDAKRGFTVNAPILL